MEIGIEVKCDDFLGRHRIGKYFKYASIFCKIHCFDFVKVPYPLSEEIQA